MLGQEAGFERIGMIEIDLGSLIEGQVFEITIVGIMREISDAVSAHFF